MGSKPNHASSGLHSQTFAVGALRAAQSILAGLGVIRQPQPVQPVGIKVASSLAFHCAPLRMHLVWHLLHNTVTTCHTHLSYPPVL